MLTIAVLLVVRDRTGSYGVAGAASAAATCTQAAVAPLFGRIIDRRTQSAVVPLLLALFLVGVALLDGTALLDGPTWMLFAGAVLAGAGLLPYGALVRTRWAYLLAADEAQMSTALALESVADEAVFITGPVLVTLLAVIDPLLGPLAAAVLASAGTVVFLGAGDTEPPRRPRDVGGGSVRPPGLWVIVVSSTLLGTVFGSIEVATIAFAQRAGTSGWAGILLGLIALGSFAAGLWYGTRAWRRDLAVRYRISLLTLAAGGLPTLLVPTVALMAPASLLVGLSIAPTLIASSGLVARIMPAGSRTEGFSWQSASINIGAAGGSALAGALVDAFGTRAGFAVGPVAAVLGSLTALLGGRWLVVRAAAVVAPDRQGADAA
jgi:MFS family permease